MNKNAAPTLRANGDEMSEYWNAVCCGAVFGFVLGFGVGGAYVHRTWTSARRKADKLWDE